MLPRRWLGLHPGQEATTLDLERSRGAIEVLDRVVAGLPRSCQFYAEDAGSLKLRHLPGDPEGLSRSANGTLSETFCVGEARHHPVHAGSIVRPGAVHSASVGAAKNTATRHLLANNAQMSRSSRERAKRTTRFRDPVSTVCRVIAVP
jgi:hypothetical protein